MRGFAGSICPRFSASFALGVGTLRKVGGIEAGSDGGTAEDGPVLDVGLPHDETGEPSGADHAAEDAAGVGVDFDGTDWLMSKNEVCEQPPPSACE